MEWVPIVFLTFKAIVLFTGMYFAIKWHYDQDRKTNNEGGGSKISSEIRLFVTMIIALAMSLIGIVYAGCWGHVADGGRGGALGFAFTFFMLFLSRPAADAGPTDRLGQADAMQGDVLAEPNPATLSESLEQLARLKIQTERLQAAMAVRLDMANREKIYLTVASIMSVLAWKFGDVAAGWLDFGH